MYSDTLRLTDDDRCGAFVTLASLLSKSRRLKEANKILSEAKVRPQSTMCLLTTIMYWSAIAPY
jgi:hypothetical protein